MVLELRERLADWLDARAVNVWSLAHRLRPVDERPRCPDCNIGPDVGDDCPVCEDLIAQKRDEEAIYASAYEAGAMAEANAHRDEGDW